MAFKVTWGCTRFVVLVGPIAIKVARLRPFRALKSLVKHRLKGDVRECLLGYADNPIAGGFEYLFRGLAANRNEYRLSRTLELDWLMPTRHSLLFGLVNIQERGEEVAPEEVEKFHPFMPFLRNADEAFFRDMTKPSNFCRHKGRVCLADYGSPETFLFLAPVEMTLRKARI